MTEKYIYCPWCRRLTVHTRNRGAKQDAIGWFCEVCNPPLSDFGGESNGESE
jgi:hypothetical protein